MRARSVRGLVAATLLALTAGCSGDAPPPAAAPSPTTAAVVPTYDAALAPSAAVLALVPDAAETLLVTDYDRVRAELGLDALTTASPVGEQEAFWERAAASAPLLSPGMLRPVEARLRSGYGLSQTDVAWEAHFLDQGGARIGWVLRMRDGVDLAAVARAVADGVGGLAGAAVRADDRLVVSGTTDDGSASWAADPATTALVGLPASSTYVERGCDADEAGGRSFEELTEYSVQFEDTLVTARLGPDRLDLFDRMRRSTSVLAFASAFEGGVADPSTGRIGFRMRDPAAAASLARDRALPFAACGAG